MTEQKELRFKDEKTKKSFEAENYDDTEMRKFAEHPLILSKRSRWKGYQAENGIVTEVEIR